MSSDRPPLEYETFYRAEDYQIDESISYLINRVRLMLAVEFDREMSHHEVSFAQWGILALMSRGKGATATELSREMHTDSGSMTRMIDRLEAKKMVRRVRSQEDRRVVRLELTEAGMELTQGLPEIAARIMNRNLRGFTREEFDLFKSFLRRMLANSEGNAQ